MATRTFTIDTDEWLYPDVNGITHAVNNAQTFTIELTDGGASNVTYQNNQNQSVTTTDGLRIQILSRCDQASGAGGNTRRIWGPTADAEDGVTLYSKRGEFSTRCPCTGVRQDWVAKTINVNNVDAPTTITASFEDTFGNSFTWTSVTLS